MYKAKVPFLWYNVGDEVKDELKENFSKWEKANLIEKVDEKAEAKKVKESKKAVNLDLNNDGKVDKKDASIASKVMNAVRKK